MNARRVLTIDGNEAVASVAYRTNEVIAIYPITPASTMGELADEWATQQKPNLWGTVPKIAQLQSEGGAAGAVHGALQAGALTTTFTASQGLLLMIPNLYKIAGELTTFCMHVATRTVATHALSIFGDHSDVMACRQTGFALLTSGSVQEAHDLACVAQAATMATRIPFIHCFDGFRTSHEIAKIEELTDADLRAMIDDRYIQAHRERALTPDRPVLRGTAQNPDTYFQAREACQPFYAACSDRVQGVMDQFGALTGRQYHLFDYVGRPDAERVIVLMGSGADTVHETVDWLCERGERVGVLKVRLYRPFAVQQFLAALPPTTRALAVLDRTKEPGSVGEPLYLDVVGALHEGRAEGLSRFMEEPTVIGGRYGLSSKEFTPAMVKAVFDELGKGRPTRHFTVGIMDDVSRTSLSVDPEFDIEPPEVLRAVFFGLGSDGTVGANKNSIKIIGEGTDRWVQGYFVYDSRKAGAMTISHLRMSRRPIRSASLIRQAGFLACHQFDFLDRYDVLGYAAPGGIFLLNAPAAADGVWDQLPREAQTHILDKRLRFHVIDAYRVAADAGLGRRINTIMQTCFFALSGILPIERAMAEIKKTIEETYGKWGADTVHKNLAAVDQALAHLHEVRLPDRVTAHHAFAPLVPDEAPDFVKKVTALMLAGKGDWLPVSAFPVDGTWPVGTAKWDKRNLAQEIPVWDSAICIQCNKCAMVCPHAAIRAKVYAPAALTGAPSTFKAVDYKAHELPGFRYSIQVAPEDCTGCNLCVMVCPAKDKSNPKHKAIDMQPQRPLREVERINYAFFLQLPEADRATVKPDVKGIQFLEPLFEYSSACPGCGETPYIKLLTQLFGDRALIANATGCSSIYGGNLPTTPYSVNRDGRGPAWSNSLFEDNAEFGFGFRLALDQHSNQARALLSRLAPQLGTTLVDELLQADRHSEAGLAVQRQRVAALKQTLATLVSPEARRLTTLADYLVRKSVWIIGGDGWAYDIGYGGLDHVLAMGEDVNILVLDTEVYSNTGGQQSKATPLGAAAKFATAGKATPKKDLGLLAMTYGTAYVARIAFGGKDTQTVRAFQEAESFPGPSLLIAYSPCIAHGYDLKFGLDQQKLAVESGYWPLYRFDPRRLTKGEPPLQLDSVSSRSDLTQFMRNETRFRMVEHQDPERFRELVAAAQRHNAYRTALYQQLATLVPPTAVQQDERPASS
ncbi:MAG: pyruvate flavodoxin/ferredoxin oxidoreductase domain protein [Nitrospira sp.]|jgi:pyruvate-ferredoxin/flavodoxin oxidoreductase|nr:pyruvate flavodoxin/ferredoxin oxidoreductase domain protein [Nitrospira sp.]